MFFLNKNKKIKRAVNGFTLLEVLLVVAMIAIIAGIAIYAINPIKQLAVSRNAGRMSDIKEIHNALTQYFVDNFKYPTSTGSGVKEICNTGDTPYPHEGINCTGYLDLSVLVPTYLSAIPRDSYATTDNGTGYEIIPSANPADVSMIATQAELGVSVAIGTTTSSGGVGGSDSCQITSTVTPVNSVYTFTSDGVFEVTSGTCDAEILIVGGGGGGGSERAGGGAGGQIYHSLSETFSVGQYAVVVGAGGLGGSGFGGPGSDGEASSLGNIYSALGGEHGTGNNEVPGSRGVPGTGLNGGGSGGYGSNIAGNCNNTVGADGSLYLSEYWAGGGGGGGWECDGKAGGAGGGGKGGDGSPELSHGTSGTPNTGGGGGGSNGWSGGGGDGGSGIVIVKLLN